MDDQYILTGFILRSLVFPPPLHPSFEVTALFCHSRMGTLKPVPKKNCVIIQLGFGHFIIVLHSY